MGSASPKFKAKLDTKDIKRLKHNTKKLTPEVQKAIVEVMRKVYADSQELVPVDTGALRASGKFSTGMTGKGKFFCTISYGSDGSDGIAVDYAVYVHEDLYAHHDDPTSAKFLEIPADRHSVELRHRVGMTIKVTMSRGR